MKTITEKGTYEIYWNSKGEIIIQFKPTFSAIKKPFRNTKTIKIKKYGEVVYKVLRGNKLKLIKAKSNGKWRNIN
ncbi:MAG: hypothetical protein Q8P15_03755 [Nanoarchaeota archaeon]|nr:hypothetical protein [Nanoarchaeota archaeon]